MLVSALIESSLRKIGAMSSGEVIEVERQAQALSALKSMLKTWGSVSTLVFATIEESLTLTTSKASYTWGVGGDINSARPSVLRGGYIVDSSSITHPVDVIKEMEFDNITAKTTLSRPTVMRYKASYPLGNLSLWPVPDEAELLYLRSFKTFTESGSYALVTDSLSFPDNYEEAIIYNLAIRLAPEYGKAIPAEVAAVAKETLNAIKAINAASRVEPVVLEVPASGLWGAGYSINSDSYR